MKKSSKPEGDKRNKLSLDTEQLRTYCDVFISKNFTQSSINLGVTESTVSYRIREMEKYFGNKLFIRQSNKTVESTEFGKSFFPEAKGILETIGKHRQSSPDGQLSGLIKITAGEIGGVYLLPAVIRSFESKFKNIRVSIEINNSFKSIKKISNAECDIGVVASLSFLPNPYIENFEVTKLLKLTYGVITPVNHALASKKLLSVKEILRYPYISRDENSGSHREILKIFDESRVRENDIKVVWKFDNSSSVINAVSEGLGISIVNIVQASRYVQAGLISFIPLKTKVESNLNLIDHWKGTNHLVNAFKNFIIYYLESSKIQF